MDRSRARVGERAKLAGGKPTIWSATDSGTEVELSVPGLQAYAGRLRSRSWVYGKLLGSPETGD